MLFSKPFTAAVVSALLASAASAGSLRGRRLAAPVVIDSTADLFIGAVITLLSDGKLKSQNPLAPDAQRRLQYENSYEQHHRDEYEYPHEHEYDNGDIANENAGRSRKLQIPLNDDDCPSC